MPDKYFVMAQIFPGREDLMLVKGPGDKITMSHDEAWRLACETADMFNWKVFVCGFVNYAVSKKKDTHGIQDSSSEDT